MISLIKEIINPKIENCNHAIFSGGAEWMNAIVWFLSRVISSLSSECMALYLFFKRKRTIKDGDPGKYVDTKFIRLYGSDVDDILETLGTNENSIDRITSFDDSNASRPDGT
jgi:hypothetical protein